MTKVFYKVIVSKVNHDITDDSYFSKFSVIKMVKPTTKQKEKSVNIQQATTALIMHTIREKELQHFYLQLDFPNDYLATDAANEVASLLHDSCVWTLQHIEETHKLN